MKYFLLDYDHDTREVTVTPIEDTGEALDAYARREGEVLGSSHEVVLFYGESEDHLRRTHARYFLDLSEMADRILTGPEWHKGAESSGARASA